MIRVANKWIGYLEHSSDDLLGIYTANTGKGGCTIFAATIRRYYPWRNFSGIPWCATFVHAVCLEAYGKREAYNLLGKPHPGSRTLARRMKRKGCLRGRDYVPAMNDLIFLHNGDGEISHVGIVEAVVGDTVLSIEGNTVDPSGVFEKREGGAVARRARKLSDPAIVCYGEVI